MQDVAKKAKLKVQLDLWANSKKTLLVALRHITRQIRESNLYFGGQSGTCKEWGYDYTLKERNE